MINKRKNNKVSSVIWWIVGVLFLITGFTYLFGNFLSGVLFLLGGIFVLPPFQRWVGSKYNLKIKTWIKVVILIFIFLIFGVFSSDTEGSQDINQNVNQLEQTNNILETNTLPLEYDKSLVRVYELAKIEDISVKAMDKPYLSYSGNELEALPMNIRKRMRVVVPTDITKEELKSTLIQIVMDETAKDRDIDLIVILVYDRIDAIDGVYTYGKAEWAPNGDWASVTEAIATTNDRSSYKYTFDIQDKVGNINMDDRPTEEEFEIYAYYDNALIEETSKLFDKHDSIPYESYDSDYIEERVSREADEAQEVEDRVTKEVAEHFGITIEELNEIFLKVTVYDFS